MIRCTKYESFYVSGTHFVPEMGIYAGWVALEGSFAAQQVFTNERRDIVLLFSGECFPDSESQIRLERNGNSRAEKEVSWLIHLYEEQGDQFFERLNGLFSGLLIDKKRNRAFLFNDRYGLERLYLCETKSGLYFASEAKALLRVLPELRALDESGVAQLLTFGCTLEWQSLFRGVQLLPGGSLWSVEGEKVQKGRYFHPSSWESQPTSSAEDFESKFDETLKRVVRRHFVAQEKIGISLTGGLDTRMIMACRPEALAKTICYTFSGQKVQTLDARLAAKVAKVCSLEHRILPIGADFFLKYSSYLDRTVYATDGYSGALGAHEIYMNEQARRLAPLRLTGVFGSEVLRGMSTFKPVGLTLDLFNPDFRRLVNFQGHELKGANEHPITFAAFREIPWNIFGSIAACRSQVTFRTPYLDNEIVALAYQAPVKVRTSSNTALCLINRNDPALGRIPTDRARGGTITGFGGLLPRVFAEATFKLDYLFNEGMPDRLLLLDPLFGYLNSGPGIIGRHKFLHYRRWFRNELAAGVREILADPSTRQSPYWNSQFLDRIAGEHIGGQKNYVREINAVLALQAVERLLIRMSSRD
jgi:asparagine synthase (glutamine-hydrolysing)